MTGRTKSNKYVGHLTRQILARNLERRLRDRYGEKKNHARRFEEEFGVNFSTTQRILNEGNGTSIDNIELCANKLGIAAYELLVPTEEMQRTMRVKELGAYEPMIRRTDESKERPLSEKTRRGSR
jgi:hypothetical protein